MAENVYEGMFILDSNRYERDPEALSGQISEMIREAGGALLISRLWEERRLAYSIKGHRRGTYWLTYFRLDSSRLTQIKRQCRLNENLLRQLFLKVDPRIVDTLVAHAQAVGAPGGQEGKGKDAPKPPEADRQQGADTTADGHQKSDVSQVTD